MPFAIKADAASLWQDVGKLFEATRAFCDKDLHSVGACRGFLLEWSLIISGAHPPSVRWMVF
jgi:hypothetical protein